MDKNYFEYQTVNDLQSSKKRQLMILIFAVFLVFLLTIKFWRRLFCKSSKIKDTPFQDPSVGGVVTDDWLKKEMSFFVEQLYVQLTYNYSAIDAVSGGANGRCQIYQKLMDLLPNQLIAVCNEYKNIKCTTVRAHIAKSNYSGCSLGSVVFGGTIEQALVDKLNRFNIS